MSNIPKPSPITLEGTTLDVAYYMAAEYPDVAQASAELPSIIEWVSSHLQSMAEAKIVSKQAIKEAEATAYFRLRGGAFHDQYSDKMTESSLSMALALDKDVKEAYRTYAIYSGWVQRLQNLILSLQAKLDLVRTVEATRRSVLGPESDNDD